MIDDQVATPAPTRRANVEERVQREQDPLVGQMLADGLRVSAPSDPLGPEAIADRVPRTSSAQRWAAGEVLRGSSVGGKGRAIQRKAVSAPKAPASIDSSGGPGSPLPEGLRADLEGRFGGQDFSGVRVHTGPKAAGMARELNARALAIGSDIYFGQGELSPSSLVGQGRQAHTLGSVAKGGAQGETPERDVWALRSRDENQKSVLQELPNPSTKTLVSSKGAALLGHELAHVVQQRQGRVRTVQAKGGEVVTNRSLEAEADAAGAALARGGDAPDTLRSGTTANGGRSAQAKSSDRPIQLFGSREHKSVGDNVVEGSYTFCEDLGPASATVYNSSFKLTHGDIIMLAGDYFSPRETRINAAGVEEPDPDSLFVLARTPSPSPGQNPGTIDEVVYAIQKAVPDDPRFAQLCTEDPEVGKWGEITFSDEVKAAVDARYLWLSASNDEHFVAPQGTDAQPLAGDGTSAGSSYRALHEVALGKAFDLGGKKGDLGKALAHEAAAQHFLTDHFAAGHLRTPRGSIRSHWGAIYPLFWDSLRSKIAMDVATWINDNDRIGYLATTDMIFNRTRSQVMEETKALPPMGFGDLVSLVCHDHDNENGLWVTNDLGMQWMTYGDTFLDPNAKHQNRDPADRTREMAELAVRLGNEDVRIAYLLGCELGEGALSPESLRAEVRSRSGTVGDRYAPEQVLPRPDPAKETQNGRQNWKQDSVETLWVTPITSSVETTFGDAIIKSLQGGELGHELKAMAEKFPAEQPVLKVFSTHPRRGFTDGFLRRLNDNPKPGILSIVHFSPSQGQPSFNQDDAIEQELAREQGAEGMTEEQMRGFTLLQRSERVRQLVGGWTSREEGDLVIRLFETASPGQRAVLYEMIEGHAWGGAFQHGFMTSDDNTWNALYKDQLARLAGIINGK